MKGFSFFARCLSLILILNLAGAPAHLYAAPPVQKSDPPPEAFPFPRSNNIEMLPHQSGVAAPANAPEHVEAASLYPYSRLTFQSFRNFADWNIYVGNDDGSGQTPITFEGASDLHPRFNRGATRIAFASRRTGNYEIFTMNPDGSGLAQLTFNGADDVQPYWSPDGSKIAFQAYRDGQPEVYVMNADGSGQIRLTTNGDYDGEPSWSPEGGKIAFVSKRTGGSGDYFIYVMNADGSGQVQLSGQAYSEGPVWSPDGTKIAYDSAGGDYWQNLWVMNADGSNQHVVFDEGGWAEAWARSWSPDSRYVAFTRIYFTQCGNNLCWTYAYLDAWDSQTGGVIRLSHDGSDWRPDWQTTDATAPSSSVQTLSAQSPSPIPVRWSGVDGGASGIASYDVQVKDGAGGVWTNWQTNTSATSASYLGVSGHTYYFRVRARDNAANLEAYPAGHDASTTVETLAPLGYVLALPNYSKDSVLVTWSGSDPGGSGIQTYDVQYKDGTGGTWINWQVGTASSSAMFNGTVGHTYYFRARATDRALNVGSYPADEDAQTTFYAWGITGAAYDNTGVPVSGMNVSTLPAGPEAFNSDAEGDYAAYVLTTASAYTTTWDKAGYGTLPATAFTGPTDAKLDVVLPPEDDIIVNGHFEAGDLVSSGWQVSGALTPTLTNTVRHTGQQSVVLGTTTLSQTGPSTLAQVVTIPPTATAPNLSFLYWPGQESPLKDGLVAYWNLDEGSGTRVDATGRGNDLSDNNTVASGVGKVGQSAQFVAANQEYLSHPDNVDLSMGDVDFTISNWVYLDSPKSNGTVLVKGNADTFNTFEYGWGYDGPNDRFGGSVVNSGSGASIPANSFGSPTADQWYFVVFWHDTTKNEIGISVNGVEDILPYSGGVWDTTFDFILGSDTCCRYWNGRIDEVGLWKRVLTMEERLALYNDGQGCTYPFFTCGPLTTVETTSTESPGLANQFSVSVDDGVTTTIAFSDTTLTAIDWLHQWVDLSLWAGQTVTVTFTVEQGSGAIPARVYLDEVTLGSAKPDVWATLEVPEIVSPAEMFVYQLTYGNQGGAAATGTYLTLTLPVEFTYSSVSLPPVISTTTELVWDVGSLAAHSGPFSIFLIASVSPTAPVLITVTSTLAITANSELETANNSQQASTLIGYQILFPVVRRD